MKKKKFDCVEMMHQAGRRIDRETKNLTLLQKIASWKQKAESAARKHALRLQRAKKGRAA